MLERRRRRRVNIEPTSVHKKHHADYIDRGNCGTTKTRKIRRVVYSFTPFKKHVYRLAERFLHAGPALAEKAFRSQCSQPI